MEISSKKIEKIYEGKVSKRYERSMPPFFLKWKQKAINESALKKGDKVLVFCCGTGLDFPYIIDKIGADGQIVGIDFSSEMLKQASEKIEKNNWNNIELIQADITKPIDGYKEKFDAGVCTLGLSIIPDFILGYNNLLACVKPGGELIIGDMQLATGLLAVFNPLTIHMAAKFGGSHKGHKNSKVIYSKMQSELMELTKKVFFLGAYFYCIGKKRT